MAAKSFNARSVSIEDYHSDNEIDTSRSPRRSGKRKLNFERRAVTPGPEGRFSIVHVPDDFDEQSHVCPISHQTSLLLNNKIYPNHQTTGCVSRPQSHH